MKDHIILINGSYAPSLITFRGKLIETLIKSGHVVHASAPDFPPSVVTELTTMGAHVHQVRLERNRSNPLGDVSYWIDLVRLIRKIKPNVVLSYTIKPNIWGSIAARICRVRSVSMVTGLGFSFSPQRRFKARIVQTLARRLYAFATRANDRIIFQNPDDICDFIKAGCLIDASKAVMVNGSGVDLDHYAVTPLPEEPVFLMIARFLGAKGLREYAAAALQVLKTRDDCRFLLVGFPDEGVDGIPQSEVEEWFANGIEFGGQLDDVRPAISAASVYVLPSYREGTPRTVLEAMAMGRAIITTDAPGCRETVIEGVNGFLVPVADVSALTNTMITLADDKELRIQMGKQSRHIAEEKYAVEKVNTQLIQHLSLRVLE
jgi:glycosyltransferase involved in cell wall biosynthesis